jgi:hypothetical protein
MNELSKEKTMTVKEVAEILNLDSRTIQLKVKELFPEKVRNGYVTNLSEREVTAVKLHLEKKFEVQTELEKDLIVSQAMMILNDRIKTLTEQKEKAESQVKMLVHDFNKLYTSTEISKELNLKSAQELNNLLKDKNIQYKINNSWVLYSDYSDKGYTSLKETVLDTGKIVYDRLWTGRGRQFILNLFELK